MTALDLGLGEGTPGPNDAITDVSGVRVGTTTLIAGDGPLRVGEGPVRTGVTVVLPTERPFAAPVHAGTSRLNGNGELTGTHWIAESGLLTTPIGLTNTHALGVVRDTLVAWEASQRDDRHWWSLPVVGETYDGVLNDINGGHVRPEHVLQAIASATDGPVAGGNVGGGTGMIAHGFKGGTGSASRVVADGWTVGALVQANHGRRARFRVDGLPVGRHLDEQRVPVPITSLPPGAGSVIVVVATDAPLLPHQCDRLAQRAGLAIGRMGGLGETSSGDLFLAFATGNAGRIPPVDTRTGPASTRTFALDGLPDAAMDALFEATVQATEAAVLHAMLAAESMTGADDVTAHALTAPLLAEALAALRPSVD
ncbi:MAG: P1 family peptidase [Actinobacteria bacterium]|nr:P1 family peptidase [Actinomycetota bacterium]